MPTILKSIAIERERKHPDRVCGGLKACEVSSCVCCCAVARGGRRFCDRKRVRGVPSHAERRARRDGGEWDRTQAEGWVEEYVCPRTPAFECELNAECECVVVAVELNRMAMDERWCFERRDEDDEER